MFYLFRIPKDCTFRQGTLPTIWSVLVRLTNWSMFRTRAYNGTFIRSWLVTVNWTSSSTRIILGI